MNDTSKIKLGQYIRSISGRDKNSVFIVIEIIDNRRIRIVDGDLRKVNNSKIKSVKHIQIINKISNVIYENLMESNKITNLMIKQEIIKFGLNESN